MGTQGVSGGRHVPPGSPRYSLEGRGDPSHRGSRAALEVPVQEEDDAEPPAMPQPGAQSPRGTSVPLVPSSHTTHRLPFGSSKPGRATFPLETLRREKRGAAGGLLRPLPGAVPTGQHSRAERGGRGPGHSPWGSVISSSPCRPQPARHLRAPGRTRLAPGWAPSTYGTSHVHRAQRPRVAGDTHTETPVTAAGAPPAPRRGRLSAGGAAWGSQLLAPRSLPGTRFKPQLQPGATRCLPVLPGHARHGWHG